MRGSVGQTTARPFRAIARSGLRQTSLVPAYGARLEGGLLAVAQISSLHSETGPPLPLNVCQVCTLTFKNAAPIRLHFHGHVMIAQRELSRSKPGVRLALLAPLGQGALWRYGATLLACGKGAADNARTVWGACYVGGG